MLPTTLTALLTLLPFALAQYDSPNYPAGTTSSAAAAPSASGIHIMEVGKGGLTFSPDTMTVPVGDSVEFRFYPMNHSVVQSTFQAPCVPSGNSALFSGFMPVSSGVGQNKFTVKINDTGAIWLYCSQATHCQMGMAAVINPPTDKTLDSYKRAAVNTNSSSPSSVQGGTVSSASSSSSSSATPKSNAGSKDEVAGKFVLVVAMAVAALML
ncbi:hypothetical protein GP486_007774 [Trichoglossum hirsutum]|uniref:Phytocyanin domain-containing protein n=1 Tax=Trichoglossum hirsutum TaxID=265104 RepID=A0A9P8IF79_9PEZI|nr:hypothetical protein GP486_007774 [Trichoglossum hirsutum]